MLAICFCLIFSFRSVQENQAPTVKISSPLEGTDLDWNSVVPYRITIIDQEDGNSDYDEINSNEVVLSLTYFDDISKVKKYVEEEVATRSDMLSFMASSNCFTCHKAKDKLIGPSFEEITQRYRPSTENMEYLAKKISQGASGVWGDQIMPAQPELETDRILQMLEWIFKNAQDPNYTFFTGIEGAFKTKGKQKDIQSEAAYVVHAQYVDHGINETRQHSKKGTSTLILRER